MINYNEPTIEDLMEKGIGYNNPRIKGRGAMRTMERALESAGFQHGETTEKPRKFFRNKMMENAFKKAGYSYSWELRKKK